MKNIALVVLLIATAVFASLYLNQTKKSIESQTAVVSLQQQVAELQSAAANQEKQNLKLGAELEQVRTDAAARNREILQLRATSTNQAQRATAAASSPPPTQGRPSNPFSSVAKMFKDPEMKEALAAQQ